MQKRGSITTFKIKANIQQKEQSKAAVAQTAPTSQTPEPVIGNLMGHHIQDLTKDIKDIDLEDILSCWQWCLADMKGVVMITVLGDMFLVGKDNAVYWLQTDAGELTQVADGLEAFQQLLNDEEQVDNFFLPQLVESLISAGKVLKENEVYSFKTLPVIGGEYSIENIDPTDMSVHFAFTGQICQQIKDLPDGTKVTVTLKQ